MKCKQTVSNRKPGIGVTPLALVFAASVFAALPGTVAAAAPAFTMVEDDTKDTIYFNNGRFLVGTIVSETATTIRFKGEVSGIPFETDYNKSEISSIIRAKNKPATGSDAGAKEAEAKAAADKAAEAKAAEAKAADEKAKAAAGGPRYYWIDLKGEFGRQISETPIRDAVADARAQKADYIIVSMKADYKPQFRESMADFGDNLSEVFRAEPMTKVFAEIPNEWDYQPTTVFWVKDAMAGAAFLPFICPNIYFHTDGRLGGLGGLSFLFRGVGDDFVQEKQKSLRMGHAEGWLRLGGYDDRLVRAMSRHEAVFTLTYENGKPVMVERMPENPGEELLTDDATDSNADSMEERVRGMGNDVLTLNARLAKLLGVSKGTVDTKDELLAQLGLARGASDVSNRSERIFKDWSTTIDNGERQLRRLIADFREIEVEGDWTERTAARARQKRTLLEMKGVFLRCGEALDARWRGERGIPSDGQIDTMIEQINIQQKLDRK